nr:Solute-binding periplasmic protein of iron/siderophore ABC transporter [Raoultella sp. NCTC 9187]
MAMKSVSSLILTALISAPQSGYATQYPLTVTDLDGRSITLQHEPQRIILQTAGILWRWRFSTAITL